MPSIRNASTLRHCGPIRGTLREVRVPVADRPTAQRSPKEGQQLRCRGLAEEARGDRRADGRATATHQGQLVQGGRRGAARRRTRLQAPSRQHPQSGRLDVARVRQTWHYCSMDATLVLGQQGRLVIPAEIRRALGLSPGDQVHLRLVGHHLVLERQQDAVAELQRLASDIPKARSLVDELLADRRLAAAAGE